MCVVLNFIWDNYAYFPDTIQSHIQIQIKQAHKSPGQKQISCSLWSAQMAKVPMCGRVSTRKSLL